MSTTSKSRLQKFPQPKFLLHFQTSHVNAVYELLGILSNNLQINTPLKPNSQREQKNYWHKFGAMSPSQEERCVAVWARVVERITDSYILDRVGLPDYRLSCFVVSYALSEFALIPPCPPSTHYWFPFHLLLLASFSSQSHILSSQKKLIEPINGTFYQKPFSTRTKHI